MEKRNDPIPRKYDGRLEGRQTLFHRTLLATTGGPTRITAVDLHLEVKDIDCNVGLTKNNCIIFSMQKMSSIHTLILKEQQILGSHELVGLAYF